MISYFTYLRETLSNSHLQSQPVSKKSLWLLGSILTVFIGLLLPFQLMQLWAFLFSSNDLGTFSQIMWYVANGHTPISTSTYPFLENQPWLGFHFSLFHFILAPFYRLFNYAPEFLCVIQVLSFALAAIPLFYAMRAWFEEDGVPLIWTAIFLFNPYTLTAASFSFQDHTLAVPLVALGLWAVVYKRFRVFVITMGCLALCKEHFGVDVAGFGILWGWYHKEWKRGLIVSLCGLIYFLLVMAVFMPAFVSHNVMMSDFHALTAKEKIYSINRYGWMKLPWPDNVGMGLYILTSQSSNYIYNLFLPTLWLAFAAPLFLLSALGDFAANTLSWSNAPRNFYFYHHSTIMPGLILSSVAAGLFFTRLLKIRHLNWIIALIILLKISYYTYNRIPNSWDYIESAQPASGLSWAFDPKFQKLSKIIPQDAKLTGFSGAVIFFANRAFFFPRSETEHANMALYRLNQPISTNPNDVVIDDLLTPTGTIKSLLDSNQWHITHWDDPWLILEKRPATAFHKANFTAINKRLEQLRQENIQYNLPKYNLPTR